MKTKTKRILSQKFLPNLYKKLMMTQEIYILAKKVRHLQGWQKRYENKQLSRFNRKNFLKK